MSSSISVSQLFGRHAVPGCQPEVDQSRRRHRDADLAYDQTMGFGDFRNSGYQCPGCSCCQDIVDLADMADGILACGGLEAHRPQGCDQAIDAITAINL